MIKVSGTAFFRRRWWNWRTEALKAPVWQAAVTNCVSFVLLTSFIAYWSVLELKFISRVRRSAFYQLKVAASLKKQNKQTNKQTPVWSITASMELTWIVSAAPMSSTLGAGGSGRREASGSSSRAPCGRRSSPYPSLDLLLPADEEETSGFLLRSDVAK